MEALTCYYESVVKDSKVIAMKFLIVLVLVLCSGCASAPSHNDLGGYVDACGDLPGLIGDDC
jgi:hypothetical protein